MGEDGGLIAGHARVLAARQLGIAKIPVMVAAGWSEAQKRTPAAGRDRSPSPSRPQCWRRDSRSREETGALASLLSRTIGDDRYPLSPRIQI